MIDAAPSLIAKGAQHADRKFYGVAVLLTGICFGVVQDAILKKMSGNYPFSQVQITRCGIAALFILAWLLMSQGPAIFRGTFSKLMVLRGLLIAVGSACFYLGLPAMSLADAVAIYFALPLMTVVLSGLVLKDHVPPWRWATAAVGFSGVALMIKPTSGLFDWASLLPLAATLFYALGNLSTRKLDRNIPSLVTAVYAGASFVVVAGALALIFSSGLLGNVTHPSLMFLTRPWAMPTGHDALMMGAIVVTSIVGLFAFAEAYRVAPPSFVAPFEYTAMVWAMALGFVFFGDIPTQMTLMGSAIIIGAGLFLGWRERHS